MTKSNSISVLVAVILDKVSVCLLLADFYNCFLIYDNVYWKANPRKF